MRKESIQRLVARVNRKHWWHCPPQDPRSYKKRGRFFASSFAEAELYGRPLAEPQRIQVSNPLVGSEDQILDSLGIPKNYPEPGEPKFHMKRVSLDARMRLAALRGGYDSINFLHLTAFSNFVARHLARGIFVARPSWPCSRARRPCYFKPTGGTPVLRFSSRAKLVHFQFCNPAFIGFVNAVSTCALKSCASRIKWS